MSMALYALHLHTSLRLLDLKLPDIRMGRRARSISVVAYADDMNIFVTSVADFAIIEEAFRLYERGSGARLNSRKSKTLAVGSWCTQETFLGIAYHTHVTILGVTFWGTIEQTMRDSWTQLRGQVRAQAKRAYTRGPCLTARMRYDNIFLLSKIWYTVQILQAPNIYTQKTTAITWYTWRGTVFRVHVSTYHEQNKWGDWRCQILRRSARRFTYAVCTCKANGMERLQTWNLTGRQSNPPHATKFPTKLAYL